MPSAISAILCVTIAAVILIASAMLQSISVGTLLPNALDGNWGLAYTNNVVQPLATVSNNANIQMVLIVFGWGLAGLLVYLIVEFIGRTRKSLQAARHNVHLSGGQVVRGNLRPFLEVAAWRLGVVAAFSAIIVLVALPILRSFTHHTSNLVLGQVPVGESAIQIPLVLLGIAFLLHCGLVFLRLFLLRMRLFRDIPS